MSMYGKLLPFLALAAAMETKSSLTPTERHVSEADNASVINEYYLIKQKKSNLSRSQRDLVVQRVEHMIKTNKLTWEGDKLVPYIKVKKEEV